MHVLVHPAAGFGGKRRAGRSDAAQSGKVVVLPRRDPRLDASRQVRGAGSEEGRAVAGGEAEQCPRLRPTGVAVELQDGAARGEHRHPQVPHDPVRRGEPEEPVALANVELQSGGLEVLEDRAAVSVHDGLRHPGRAGRIDDPERVRERNGRECQRRWRGDRLDERDGARRSGHVDGGPGIEVRHHHDRLDGWQLPNDLAYRLSAVERLPAIAVPIHCEEHLRFDLAEAVDYAGRTHVGRRAGPDRAQARAREHGDDGLGDVRQVGGYAITRPDAETRERRGQRPDLCAEGAPRQLEPRPRLGLKDESRARHPFRTERAPERLFRVAYRRAFEPARAGHHAALEHALVRAMRDHPAEVPDRRPERLQLLYRPAPERVVAIEAQASLPLEPAPVAGDSGGLDPCG